MKQGNGLISILYRTLGYCISALLVSTCAVSLCAAQSLSTPGSQNLPEAPQVATTPPLQTTPSPGYVFPDRRQRAHAYLYDLLGPGAFLGPGVTAGIDQARPLKIAYPPDGYPGAGLHPAHGTVPEWGLGFEGYTKRYADRFGQGLLNNTSRYALGEVLHQDVTYHRCACTGFVPRSMHAFGQTFLAHTQSGHAVPSLPAIVSPYIASEVAVAAWYPARYNASDALRVSVPIFIQALPRAFAAEFRKEK